jgi:hypothetical protein
MNMSEDQNQSINYDEIEEFISNEEKLNTQSEGSSSAIIQVQNINLSMEKSSVNNEETKSQTKKSVLTVKTSNIPGPVGLLPILVRLDFILKSILIV